MEKILEDTRVILFGYTKFSEQIFNELINNSVKIVGIFTIPKHFGISYSEEKVLNVNYVDFFKLGEKYNIPVYTVESGKKKNIASFSLHAHRRKTAHSEIETEEDSQEKDW